VGDTLIIVECVFIFLFISVPCHSHGCANVLGVESSENLVPCFPRGPWTPKDKEVMPGIGRPRNPEVEERHMRALGTRGIAITARCTNHSSFHLNMCTGCGSWPPVTTNICSITGWLVRVYHHFCWVPAPYWAVNTPSVECATLWQNSNDMTNSLMSTTEVPQYKKSVEKRGKLEPNAKQVRLLCIISLFYLPIS